MLDLNPIANKMSSVRWEPVFNYISQTTFLLVTLRAVRVDAQISPTEFCPKQENSKAAELENYFINKVSEA